MPINILLPGARLKSRTVQSILRYVRYNKSTDPQNFYREQLLLLYPWRNEHVDSLAHYNTYEEHYANIQHLLQLISQSYDRKEVLIDESTLPQDDHDNFDDIAPRTQHEDLADARLLPEKTH